jgi:CelD/BcsL family acetyltransferase involved in cellulose biosynthesis
MKFETTLLRERAAIDTLALDWDRLLHDAPQDFDGLDASMGFVWFDALRAAFPGAASPQLLCCRENGRLVGLLPTVPLGQRLIGRHLGLPTELYGGRCGPLLPSQEPAASAVLHDLLQGLARQGDWSSLQLTLTEGRNAERLRTTLQRMGWQWREEAVPASAGFPLPPAGTPLRDSLPSNIWQSLRKAQNKAAKLGSPVRTRVFSQESEAAELLEAVLRIERLSWKHESGTAITNHPVQQRFYEELFPRALRAGLLQALVLYVGEEPVAHHFGLLRDGVFCCLKHSQVQSQDAISPSNLLMAELLPHLAAQGARAFDWMGVVEPHKLRWSAANWLYHRSRFCLYRPGRLGWLQARLARWRAAKRETSGATAVSGSPSSLQGAAVNAPLAARVVGMGAELEALAPQWPSLLLDSPEDLLGLGPTNALVWMTALAESRPTAAAARVLLLERSGVLQGALPVVRHSRGLLGVRMSAITELYGGRNGPLLRDTTPELAMALLKHLRMAEPRWVSLKLTVVKDSPNADALLQACRRLGLVWLEVPVAPTAFVRLLDSTTSFLAGVSRSLQRNLRQSLRLANERGSLSWCEFDQPQDAEALMALMMDIESRSWKHEAGTSVTLHPEQEAFYRALAPRALREGMLHALVLYLNDVPVSYQLGIRHGAVYLCLKNSMRDDMKDLRPSHLLKMELFERLRARGVRTVDLGGVVESHKLVWAEETPQYERVTLVIHRAGLRGRLLLAARRLRSGLRQRGIQVKTMASQWGGL